ncbi:uncharacterized protein L201_003216 [Kwoniella dendrophila CBS 6074]|uniref:Cupin type-1 domain-containing protein n=1 Tax=Kwoniella dendrophila CBS 6074 TaxID=1295534 RepID=A0AAX4JTU0_9TREE
MSEKEPHHPLLKAEEIDSALKGHGHYLNREAVRHSTCMSDTVGMQKSGLGVHKVRLEPHCESTQIHYHLNDSEWLYILSGSGILQLIDSSILGNQEEEEKNQKSHPREKDSKVPNASLPIANNINRQDVDIEEREVSPGDFIGFQGGTKAGKYAHGLKAGSKGLEYLMGGTRKDFDICCYPELGISNIADKLSGQEIITKIDTVDTSSQ